MRPAILFLVLSVAPGLPELTEHQFTGFPAIAKGGKTVALVDTEVAEAANNEHFESGTLRFISTANGKDQRTIALQFLKAEEDALEEPFKGRLATAQAALKKEEFHSLPILEPGGAFSSVFEAPALTVSDASGKQVLSTKLPVVKEPAELCLADEGITDKKVCEHDRLPQLEHVWIDESRRILVVQYGYYEGREGTERGPEFVVLKF